MSLSIRNYIPVDMNNATSVKEVWSFLSWHRCAPTLLFGAVCGHECHSISGYFPAPPHTPGSAVVLRVMVTFVHASMRLNRIQTRCVTLAILPMTRSSSGCQERHRGGAGQTPLLRSGPVMQAAHAAHVAQVLLPAWLGGTVGATGSDTAAVDNSERAAAVVARLRLHPHCLLGSPLLRLDCARDGHCVVQSGG